MNSSVTRDRARADECRTDALYEAAGDQYTGLLGHSGARRRQRENRQAGQEEASAAEQITQAPAEHQQPTVGDGVAVDDPCQARGREAEIVLDGGQCDIDHGHIEKQHHLHQADDRERAPPARIRFGSGTGPSHH
nr:hypothetical protein [Streptomyces sp. MC1]